MIANGINLGDTGLKQVPKRRQPAPAIGSMIDRLKEALPHPKTVVPGLHSKGGGEVAGPCPKCGGDDRFYVRKDGSFGCRQCNPKGGDVIDFHTWHHNTDLNGLADRYLTEQKSEKKTKLSKARATYANLTKIYDFVDESGTQLFQVRRYEEEGCEKTFRQYHKVGNRYVRGVKGVRRVIYRLPEVIKAAYVIWVEGEKDADRLASMELTATTSPMGANSYKDEYAQFLKGKHVAIIPDNDEPGRLYAKQVDKSLQGVAASVRIVFLPGLKEKGDVSDWLDGGGTKEQLIALIDQAPEARPEDKPKEHGGFDGFPSLDPDACRVQGRLTERPPSREILIFVNAQPFLPKGVVGALCATGGTGKTKLLLAMIDAATSDRELPPFKGKFGALIISGEDDRLELDRRLWDAAKGGPFGPNLYVAALPGEIGPLMELHDGNPIRSKWFDWLDRELCKYDGLIELLVLDPMSRFFGLEENRNEHGTAFVSGLEYLAHRHGITILFACHTNEESQKKPPIRMNKTMLRGGSAIGDACRLIIGMRAMIPASAENMNIEDPQNYVELDIVKTNYTPKLKSPIFFKHSGIGGFKYTEPAQEHMQAMAEVLYEMLKNDPTQYTKRELVKLSAGADITREMKESFPKFVRSKEMPRVIDWLLRGKFLKTETINSGRNQKEILVVNDV